MASGKEHTKILVFGAPFVVGAALVVYPDWRGVSAALGYLLGGFFGDPDLDIDGTTITERRLRDSVPILGWLFVMFWMPFALLAKHRGKSHTLVLGTLIRAGYVVAMSALCILAVGAFGSGITILSSRVANITYSGPLNLLWSLRLVRTLLKWLVVHRVYVGPYLVGWGIADLFHLIFDLFPGMVPILPGERREGLPISPYMKRRSGPDE